MNLYDRMTDLAACLCVQIEEDQSPEPCFCGVVPGDRVVAAYATDCDERDGVAWVRMANMYPAETVGQQSTKQGNCSGGLGTDLEVGLIRAFPIPPDGEDFDVAILASMVEQQVKDTMTLYRAILCCPSIPSKDVIVGMYAPMPILGGIYGGSIQVHLAL